MQEISAGIAKEPFAPVTMIFPTMIEVVIWLVAKKNKFEGCRMSFIFERFANMLLSLHKDSAYTAHRSRLVRRENTMMRLETL